MTPNDGPPQGPSAYPAAFGRPRANSDSKGQQPRFACNISTQQDGILAILGNSCFRTADLLLYSQDEEEEDKLEECGRQSSDDDDDDEEEEKEEDDDDEKEEEKLQECGRIPAGHAKQKRIPYS